jgi:uncharacterized protein YqjF (DUF2071 family)
MTEHWLVFESETYGTLHHIYSSMDVPLAMGWRQLLFANWPVDPATVTARLPDALDVDTYDGDAWLSVVPFTNISVRPRGLPAAVGADLPELNLRTYVTYKNNPGVYFFSLDAAGLLGVIGARLFHHLPYYYAQIQIETTDDNTQFRSKRFHPGDRPVHFTATYEPMDKQFAAETGSRAEFLTERYRFYTEGPDGRVRYTNVDHDIWSLYSAAVSISENTLFQANGFDVPEREPVFYYSPGVDVIASSNRTDD